MAIRNIRTQEDPILKKKCKTVKEITPKILELLDDMAETMHEANGVGLAAPQVGILKNIVVIDVGDGLIELINPQITESSGSQTGNEGCLSVPGVMGQVTRPNVVTVRALDRNGDEIEITGEGLLARAFCHEIDHLSGILYTELVEGELMEAESEDEEDE